MNERRPWHRSKSASRGKDPIEARRVLSGVRIAESKIVARGQDGANLNPSGRIRHVRVCLDEDRLNGRASLLHRELEAAIRKPLYATDQRSHWHGIGDIHIYAANGRRVSGGVNAGHKPDMRSPGRQSGNAAVGGDDVRDGWDIRRRTRNSFHNRVAGDGREERFWSGPGAGLQVRLMLEVTLVTTNLVGP